MAERARKRQTAAMQKAMVDSASLAIISTDLSGVVTSMNTGAEQMLGYSRGEIENLETPLLFLEPAEVKTYATALDQELKVSLPPGFDSLTWKARAGFAEEAEWTCVRKDGSHFPTRLTISGYYDDNGRILGYLFVASDNTEQKETDRLKNEFLSLASHELRTPLTAIHASLAMLQGGIAGQLSPEVVKLVDIAASNSQHLLALINDLLDIEKLRWAKMSFNFEPQLIAPLIEQTLRECHSYGDKYNIKFEIKQILPDVLVNIDRERIRQVLANFLSNSAKYSQSGDVVHVSMEDRGIGVRVNVIDHGPGVPKSFRPHLFTKFAQAESIDTRKEGGTGLGLSICKSLIESHGGQIGFEETPGKGSTFFFELPKYKE